jgi:glycosyltransferase involved in cell wall biosynthesis
MGRVAYLINQYPKISHSFVRREIVGVEACGIQVARFAIRSCAAELVDEADRLELQRTRIVLDAGKFMLILGFMRIALTKPFHLLQALWLALMLGLRSDRGVFNHLAYLAEACVLLRWFSEVDVVHVHAHFGTNSTTVALLCNVLGGPSYSFTIHGPEEFDKAQSLALAEKVIQAAFVVVVSSFGRSQLLRWCAPTQWGKIHVIHCGVDHQFLVQQLQAIPAKPRLVCVGRLCEDKGQLLLLEAAQRLKMEGLMFKLVLVGDGPLRPAITKQIAQMQLENEVEITGWASNEVVRQSILESRAMVLPSFAEGLPVVIMEAFALGRPVISTYIAGIPELVESHVSGWLVPAGSVDDLAAAMRSALQLPIERLEAMGRAGMKRVMQHHDSAIEAAKLAALFPLNIEKLTCPLINTPPAAELHHQHSAINIHQTQ